jgi:PKD repeat protein
VASFDEACVGLDCSFTDTSSDGDGHLVSWTWDFGDGNASSAQSPMHTYPAAGTYTVALTVTDDDGATSDASHDVTVSVPGPGGITLQVTGYKAKGLQKADLAWTGAGSATVDVYRDGVLIATTANDGAYTDPIDQRGGGSYTYTVCEADTSTCSAAVTIGF